MRKVLCAAAVGIILAALFTACGKGAAGSAAQTGLKKSQMDGRKKGSLPLSDGSVTFTAFIGILNPDRVTTLDAPENLWTQKVLDETGVKFNFITAAFSDFGTKLNTLLASGDYPEVIFRGSSSRTETIYYANQGIFLPLDDYHYLEYPNIKAAFDQYPIIKEQLGGPDGKMYAFPQLSNSPPAQDDKGKSFIYMPWVRENNLKVPTTLAELTDYLRFIRDNDVNHNGDKNDEIPLIIRNDYIFPWGVAMFAKMFMPFVCTHDYFGLALDENRQIWEQYKAPPFREALKTMASFYKEGLITDESFTVGRDELRSLAEGKDPVLGVVVLDHIINATNLSGRMVDFGLTPVLAGPTGLRYGSNRDPWGVIRVGWAMTDKCQDPELMVAFYDWYLNWDSQEIEGINWVKADPGAVSVSGEKAYKKALDLPPERTINTAWHGNEHTGIIADGKNPLNIVQADGVDLVKKWIETGDPSLRDQVIANPDYYNIFSFTTVQEHIPFWLPDNYFIPPIIMSDEDQARNADINALLNGHIIQAIQEFIAGVRNINSDADWNAYLRELDEMGAKERADLMQKYVK